MSQDEIIACLKAYNNNDKKDWERTRTECYYNYIYFNGTKHIKKPKDLFILPWEDNKTKGVTLSKDDFFNIANKIRNGK
jgi:hypothetical protein